MRIVILLIIYLSAMNLSAQIYKLYGGENNAIFLGNLNTNKSDAESIWNRHGKYGSTLFAKSIWNRVGIYGSKYKKYSPWNKHTTNGPLIIDSNGYKHGYMSANRSHPQRTQLKWVLWILDNKELCIEDPDKAFNKLF